jgi:hypothetical protein
VRPLSFLSILILASSLSARAEDWRTIYETSGFSETSRYDETVAFCKRLDKASPAIQYSSFGTTAEGRELPLLEVQTSDAPNQPLLFIVAGIHAGEIDGKDAGLMLIRDAVILKKYPGLLDGIRIAFVPIFNADGHERFSAYSRPNQIGPKEMGWRTTAQNLNLNRDWMKADSPEMRAMLKEIAQLNPDILVDIHVSDGADYQYVITYGLETHENALEPLRRYCQDVFLPEIKHQMQTAGYDFVPYVLLRKGYDIMSGWTNESYEPRFSTGYGALINRPFMLIETHSLKDYHTRVTAVYNYLKAVIETIKRQSTELILANREADSTASHLSGTRYTLDWDLTGDSTLVEFEGVDYQFVDSPTGGAKVPRWGTEPKTYTVPFFTNEHPVDTVTVPYAYVIPRPWLPVIEEALVAHHLDVKYMPTSKDVPVESYRFSDVSFAPKPYEGKFRVSFKSTSVMETLHLPAGSAVVVLDQPRAQVAIHLLEPSGPDSFLRWGFFSQIFEQKEYVEPYVADTLAARMLSESPELPAEFNARLKSDSAFAASQDARFQFFNERSPYWDRRKDLYPIGRITTAEGLQNLLH